MSIRLGAWPEACKLHEEGLAPHGGSGEWLGAGHVVAAQRGPELRDRRAAAKGAGAQLGAGGGVLGALKG